MACGSLEKPSNEEAIMAFLDKVEGIRRRGDTCLFVEKRGMRIQADTSWEFREEYGPEYILRFDVNTQLWCTFGFIPGEEPRQGTFFKTPRYGPMELDEVHHTYYPRIFIFDKRNSSGSVRLLTFRMREVLDDMFAVDSADGITINRIGPKGMEIATTTYRNWSLYEVEQRVARLDTLKFEGSGRIMKLSFEWISKAVQVPSEPNSEDYRYDVVFYWDEREGVVFETYHLLNDDTRFYVYALPSCRHDATRIAQLIDSVVRYDDFHQISLSPQSPPSSP